MKYATVIFFLFFTFCASAGTYPVVRERNPFVGSRLYVPNDSNKHTSVVMLHGSEGGSESHIDSEANILATQGYTVLVLCYFDCNRGLIGPRQTLKNVEATIGLEAVKWLRERPQSNGKVVVYGFSRGAELTMVLGSLNTTPANRPDALIAHSPSDVFKGPWNWSWRDHACWLCRAGIGQCPQGSPKSAYQWNPACGADDPNDPTKINHDQSAWLISGAPVQAGHRIEIEKYDGPILITVGERDEVWPVDQTRRIEATLRSARRTPQVHYFPQGGHGFRGNDEITRRELCLKLLEEI